MYTTTTHLEREIKLVMNKVSIKRLVYCVMVMALKNITSRGSNNKPAYLAVRSSWKRGYIEDLNDMRGQSLETNKILPHCKVQN